MEVPGAKSRLTSLMSLNGFFVWVRLVTGDACARVRKVQQPIHPT